MNTRNALYAAGVAVCATIGLFLASPQTLAGPPTRAVSGREFSRPITVRAQSPQTGSSTASQQRGRNRSALSKLRQRASSSPIGRFLRKMKPKVSLPRMFRAKGRQIPITRSRKTKRTANGRTGFRRNPPSRRYNNPTVQQSLRATVTPQPQSEVQRQLQLLYQKDGRQMPSMNLDSAAVRTQARRSANTPNPYGRDLRRRTGGRPQRRPSFMERINPFRRWSSKKRKQASSRTPRQPKPRTSRPRGRFQPRPFPFGTKAALQAIKGENNVKTATNSRTERVRQQEPGRVRIAPGTTPRSVANPVPIRQVQRPFGLDPIPQDGSEKKQFVNNRPVPATPEIPVLIEDEGKSLARTVPPVPPIEAQPQNRNDDDLSNAFPQRSEAEADKARQTDNSPFSGLKLRNDPISAKIQTRPKTLTESNIAPKNDQSAIAGNSERTANERPTQGRAAYTRKPVRRKKPNADKFLRIAARRGQRGFKGFCPVVLRDQRDLVDSQPKISARYRGKTYHFSSSAAKFAFESSPEKYAPVKEGRDVILLANNQRSIQGTLDYAVWFKDRLYLFSRPETMKAFVLQPKRFAVTTKN